MNHGKLFLYNNNSFPLAWQYKKSLIKKTIQRISKTKISILIFIRAKNPSGAKTRQNSPQVTQSEEYCRWSCWINLFNKMHSINKWFPSTNLLAATTNVSLFLTLCEDICWMSKVLILAQMQHKFKLRLKWHIMKNLTKQEYLWNAKLWK